MIHSSLERECLEAGMEIGDREKLVKLLEDEELVGRALAFETDARGKELSEQLMSLVVQLASFDETVNDAFARLEPQVILLYSFQLAYFPFFYFLCAFHAYGCFLYSLIKPL